MNALNINNFKFQKRNNDYLYIIERKKEKYILKRILNNNEIIIITVFNNIVEFEYINNKEKINNIDLLKKDIIVNDILDALKSKILMNFIDFDKISYKIKESYINIDYSNNNLGLSVVNNNLINIILLKTNSIIGTIKIDYDVKMNIDEIYLKESLELLNSYLKCNKNKRLVLA